MKGFVVLFTNNNSNMTLYGRLFDSVAQARRWIHKEAKRDGWHRTLDGRDYVDLYREEDVDPFAAMHILQVHGANGKAAKPIYWT